MSDQHPAVELPGHHLADYLALGSPGDGTAMGRTTEIPAGATLSPLFQVGAQGITLAPLAL